MCQLGGQGTAGQWGRGVWSGLGFMGQLGHAALLLPQGQDVAPQKHNVLDGSATPVLVSWMVTRSVW